MDNEQKIRIGVIFGGRSGEHDVSLMSARSVLNALDPDRYIVTQIGITRDGKWLAGAGVLDMMTSDDPERHFTEAEEVTIIPDPTNPGLYQLGSSMQGALERMVDLDVVFPVLHGSFGEDGTLQGLLEMAEIAYIGAGVLGSAAGMDKGLFKDVMRANDIPVLDWVLVNRSELESSSEAVLDKVEASLDYPVFVKPANLGSSVGITRCISRSDLVEGLMEAAQYDRRIIIEQGLDAREIEVSVLGNDEPSASVPGEVLPSREFYSYESKYIDGTSDLLIPAPIPSEIKNLVQEMAVKAYTAIDCAGMARVDFLLDKNVKINDQANGLFMNEVNTIPGFTEISMYPKLWDASSLPYPALVDRLVDLALERKADRDRILRVYRSTD